MKIDILFNSLYSKYCGPTSDDKKTRIGHYRTKLSISSNYGVTHSILGISEEVKDKSETEVWEYIMLGYLTWALSVDLYDWMAQNDILLISASKTKHTPLDLITFLECVSPIYLNNKDKFYDKDSKRPSDSKVKEILSNMIISKFTQYLLENKINKIAIDLEISSNTRKVKNLLSILLSCGWSESRIIHIKKRASSKYAILLTI